MGPIETGVVVVFHVREPDSAPGAVSRAYARTSWAAGRVPGLRHCELMRDLRTPGGYALWAQWSDLAAFEEWRTGPDHAVGASPLRPFAAGSGGRHFGVYERLAVVPADGSGTGTGEGDRS